MIKRMIVVFLSVAFCILNCSPILAVEQKNKFEEWTVQIFNNNYEYDVINIDAQSVRNDFCNNNKINYENGDYETISNYFVDNRLSYSRNSSKIELYATTSKPVYKDFLDQFTQNGKTITVETRLESTLRVNENTGIIHSYSGPYLSLTYDNAGYAFTTNFVDASTNAVLSSTGRTVTLSCSYRTQSVAAFQEGGVKLVYTSPVFKHSFTAG